MNGPIHVVNAGRKVKAYNRAMFHEEGRKVLIALHVNQLDEPCGMYDEGLVPRDIARNLVTEWEILLRRTTIYLCAWADGIVSPKVLRKYILKANPDWVKLYRYIWLKCQANHLGVFLSPKTFALATFTGYEAIEQHRAKIQGETSLPPAKAKDSFRMQIVTMWVDVLINLLINPILNPVVTSYI